MLKAARRKAGRSRRVNVQREPNGQQLRANQIAERGPPVPVEILAKRTSALGVPMTLDATERVLQHPAFGSAAASLYETGVIDDAQRDAALRLAGTWRVWARLIGAPPRTPVERGTGGSVTDPGPEEWDDIKRRMADARGAVKAAVPGWGLAWAMLESICADNIIPPRIARGGWYDGAGVLRRALDAVAQVYGVRR